MGERVVLDRLGGIAQRLELGQPVGGGAALVAESRVRAKPSAACSVGSAERPVRVVP